MCPPNCTLAAILVGTSITPIRMSNSSRALQFPISRLKIPSTSLTRSDLTSYTSNCVLELAPSSSLSSFSVAPFKRARLVIFSRNSTDSTRVRIAGPFSLLQFRGLRPSTKAPRTLLLGSRPAQTSGLGAPLVATPKNHHLRKFMRRRTRTQHARTGQRTVHRLLSKQGSTVLLFWR